MEKIAQNENQIKPGEDFYMYINAEWLKSNPIPDEYSVYGAFHELYLQNQKQILEILEELKKNTSLNDENKKILSFFNSGMDEKRIETNSLKPLIQTLSVIDSVKSQSDLIIQVAQLHLKKIFPFFRFFADQDEKNSKQMIGHLQQGGLSLPDREYYLNQNSYYQDIRKSYVELISSVFELIGVVKDQSQVFSQKIVEIETFLAQNSMPLTEMRDPLRNYNPVFKEELLQIGLKSEWENYFNTLNINNIGKINLRQKDFFHSLEKIWYEFELKDLKNYLKWKVLIYTAPMLNKKIADLHFDFYGRKLSGLQKQQERWKRMIEYTNMAMGEGIGKLYVKKYFPNEALEAIRALVSFIRKAFSKRIIELSWMSEATKQKALEKLASMNLKLAYPHHWKDYSALKVTDEVFIHNIFNANEFHFKDELKKLWKETDYDEWHMYPQTVNAYFNPNLNEIVFPAAILQSPFFDYRVEMAYNFGAIGSVIAHEMTHGFDDKGRLFDADGNLNDWWTKEDELRFNEVAQQLVEHFNSMHVLENLTINGELCLGENIADLGGISIALEAMKEFYKQPIKPEHYQMFFKAYATIWRQNIREEELRKRILTDVHSPAKNRVNGIVYQLDDFYDTFHIVENEKNYLAKHKRIKIW